ncbi:Ribosomal protein [Parasponia andersonii]|uniref:Ribosomal protein n=1 Tax=Parasponia andersonii TaxID=3476 RepID=A0A2P5D4V5_PARAD|nr:Ribosomal protein [Parasponia andersonii]
MSTSALFGAQLVAVRGPWAAPASVGARRAAPSYGGGLVIECSSRPNKKATAHHKKTRPRKTQPWDIKRKPTVYAPLPPLPPEWTFASEDSSSSEVAQTAVSPSSAQSPSAD